MTAPAAVPVVVLGTTSTIEHITDLLILLLARLGGLAVLSGMIALVAAFLYRWYVREPIPRGLAVLLGLSAIAAVLNTTAILGDVILGDNEVTQVQAALYHIGAFAAGLLGANGGRRIGDDFAADVFEATSFGGVEEDVGRLVSALGRVITVELPEDIDDVVGYDPVPQATRDDLAGTTFVFPRRLTVEELRDRLVARLKTDYAVGHVDVELAADGTVEYLGVGSRAAGIGPTLPPATNAMAIRADPAFAASAGDLVQVWEPSRSQRVLTAELRGVAGDVVTIAIDAADTSTLDPATAYRLVTLPVEDRPDREFVSLLRAADETFAATAVGVGSALDGMAVGAIDVTVIAVTPEGGEPAVLPAANRPLSAGDVVHAIGRPDALRRLEAAAEPVATGDDPGSPDADPRESAGEPVETAGGRSIGEPADEDEDRRDAPGVPDNDDAPARPDEGGDDRPTAVEATDSEHEAAGTASVEPTAGDADRPRQDDSGDGGTLPDDGDATAQSGDVDGPEMPDDLDGADNSHDGEADHPDNSYDGEPDHPDDSHDGEADDHRDQSG